MTSTSTDTFVTDDDITVVIDAACNLSSAAAAARVRTIGERRGQGVLPHSVEGYLFWAFEARLADTFPHPLCYWEEDGHGGASYESCTGNTVAHVDACGRVTGKTRTRVCRLAFGHPISDGPAGDSDRGIDLVEALGGGPLMSDQLDRVMQAFGAAPYGQGKADLAALAMRLEAPEWEPLPADWLG